MKPVRLIFVVLASLFALFGVQRSASAGITNCQVSSTTLQQGESFTVSGTGPGFAAGQSVRAVLDGTTLVGIGFMSGSPPSYSFTATIPTTASAPGTHSLTATTPADGDFVNCPSLFVTVAPAATPTPTPTPIPTASPTPVATTAPPVAAAPTFPPFVFVPVSVSQQQQQQQQQQAGGGGGGGGSGGGGKGQQQGGGGAGGGQQQQQQQQSGGGGGILPRTGVDIGKTAAWGAGLLAFGLLLVMFARRRRRIARSRALALLPPIDAVLVESDEPWVPGTAHPSEFLTEADGVPPVYLPEVEQLYLPPAPEANADDDVLTPSF